MQLRHHPTISTLARVAAIAAVAGGVVAACGSDDTAPTLSSAGEAGREVVRSNGCAACHGRNGEGGPGPSFVGLYGSTVALKDGSTVLADEEYLRESIRDPAAKVVDGFGFPMPGNDLSDDDIDAVIAFIRDLAQPEEAAG